MAVLTHFKCIFHIYHEAKKKLDSFFSFTPRKSWLFCSGSLTSRSSELRLQHFARIEVVASTDAHRGSPPYTIFQIPDNKEIYVVLCYTRQSPTHPTFKTKKKTNSRFTKKRVNTQISDKKNYSKWTKKSAEKSKLKNVLF